MSGTNEVYQAKLGYFNLVNFLKDMPRPSSGSSSQDASEDTSDVVFDAEEVFLHSTPLETPQKPAQDSPCSSVSGTQRPPIPPLGIGAKKRKTSSNSQSDLATVLEKLLQAKELDSFDLIGQIVASKLRAMAKEQSTAAEVLICEVLYLGQQNKLNPDNPRDILRDTNPHPPLRCSPMQNVLRTRVNQTTYHKDKPQYSMDNQPTYRNDQQHPQYSMDNDYIYQNL